MGRLMDILKKMHNPLINRNGFTLIEAIATIAIVGIVVTPIAMVFQGSLMDSLESRKVMKANQMGQQYVELLEAMEYEDLKRLVDDYDGLVDSVNIISGGFDLPEPLAGYEVVVDLHYGALRSDGLTADPDYNTAFDDLNFILSPTIANAPLPSYNMLLHFETALANGFDYYSNGDSFNNGNNPPTGTYASAVSNRDISIQYSYTASNKANTEVKVTQSGVSKTYSFVTGTENNQFVLYCDDDVSEGSLIDTNVDIQSYVEEDVTLYVYESVNDKVRPNINIGLGEVNVIRGLSIVDTTSNTHRIYEIEVTVTDAATSEQLIHVVTTRLAK